MKITRFIRLQTDVNNSKNKPNCLIIKHKNVCKRLQTDKVLIIRYLTQILKAVYKRIICNSLIHNNLQRQKLH